MDEQTVRRAFHNQAQWCDRLGSPFTARLLRLVEPLLNADTATGRRLLSWQGRPDALGDSLPLRLAGGLHHLAREGQRPWWSMLYPPQEAGDAALAAGLRRLLSEQDATLERWLDHAPQTNEVARASLLYAGLTEISRRTGCALSLFELGASAGLNLNLDRFHYDLGGRLLGDPSSAVRLAPRWLGAAPRGSEPRIIAREGNDIAPIDVTDESAASHLLAYVWADQSERLARLRAAIAIARAHPPRLVAADAADWVAAMQEEDNDVCRVLFHSIAFQYLPEASRMRVREHMTTLGSRATAARPLAWLTFEPEEGRAVLRLSLWPHGLSLVLASADAHGRAVEWLVDQG